MKRWTMIALALVLVGSLAGCTAPATTPTGTTDKTTARDVMIGFAAPLTGDNAIYGLGMQNAVKMAIDDVNASPEAQSGKWKFDISAQDDQGDPKQAVNVANLIVPNPKIIGVVGHFNSGCSIPASPVYNQASLVMISVSSNPKLTAQGFENVDRIVPKDDAQGAYAAKMVKDLGYASVVIVDDSTPYGEGLAKEFRKQYEEAGGKVLANEKIQSKETDFKALVTKFEGLNPQAIYYGGGFTEGALISKQAKEAGLKVPVIGGDMLYTGEYIKLAGATNAEGDICTILGVPTDQQPGGQKFIADYKAKFGKDPEAYDSYAYDSARIIMAAAMKVGSADRIKITSAVRALKWDGVTGTTSFDQTGDTTNQAISSYKVVGGKWEQIKK